MTSMTVRGAPAYKKPPSIPTNIIATAVGSNQINLEWQANPLEVNIKYYNIHRRKSTERKFQLIAHSYTNSYIDRGLEHSSTYYYHIAAVQEGDTKEFSEEVSIETVQ